MMIYTFGPGVESLLKPQLIDEASQHACDSVSTVLSLQVVALKHSIVIWLQAQQMN